ncbi:unnamed protein product [Caenorhabditis brenneri]
MVFKLLNPDEDILLYFEVSDLWYHFSETVKTVQNCIPTARPEGFLRILHFEDDKWPMREPIVPPGQISETRVFEMELQKEPKKYKELKEQFEKVKKDQERRVRWGQELEIRDGLVFKICKTLEGDVVESVDPNDQVKVWQVLDIPDDLEKIDGMTDEEVAKWRKERMEKIQIVFEKLGVYWRERKSPITDILKDMEKQVAEKERIVENGKKANLIFEKSKESKVKKVEKSKVEKPKPETIPPKK